jgi:Skp family chaperone for outer membrane proteins
MCRSIRLTAAAVLLAGGFWAGAGFRSGASVAETPAKEAAPLRTGHICMAEFMAKCRKWQAEAAAMTKLRAEKSEILLGLRTASEQKAAAAAAAVGDDRTDLQREAAALREKFEEAQKKETAEIDGRSATILRALHKQFSGVIADLVRERNFDAVYAYPACPTHGIQKEQEGTASAMDLYFRPPAMNPIYLRDSADLTDEVIRRMNQFYDTEQARAKPK